MRQLQEANHNLQSAIDSIHIKASALEKDKEQRVSALLATIATLQDEKGSEAQRTLRLTHQVNTLLAEQEDLRAAIGTSYHATDRLKRDNSDIAQRFQMAVAEAKDTSAQYLLQIKQHQDLLQTLQSQKSELQNQNQQLRAEINNMYNSAIRPQ